MSCARTERAVQEDNNSSNKGVPCGVFDWIRLVEPRESSASCLMYAVVLTSLVGRSINIGGVQAPERGFSARCIHSSTCLPIIFLFLSPSICFRYSHGMTACTEMTCVAICGSKSATRNWHTLCLCVSSLCTYVCVSMQIRLNDYVRNAFIVHDFDPKCFLQRGG